MSIVVNFFGLIFLAYLRFTALARQCRKALLTAPIILLCSHPALADNLQRSSSFKAQQLFSKMTVALNERSYTGTMTYEFGGPLETLTLSRQDFADGAIEQVRHLHGRPRHFARQLPVDYCGSKANRLTSAAEQAIQSGAKAHPLTRFYSFALIGRERIADREAVLVKLTPILGDRYGFVLGIDVQTYLPLMLKLVSLRGRVLERFQFVTLSPLVANNTSAIDSSTNAIASAHSSLSETPSVATPDLTINSAQQPISLGPRDNSSLARTLKVSNIDCQPVIAAKGWLPRWLPPGFVLASRQVKTGEPTSQVNNDKTRLNFTDGLASVSVFVSPSQQASPAVGVAQRGATVAAMTMINVQKTPFKVAVVGEIPPAVARKIAASMVYQH